MGTLTTLPNLRATAAAADDDEVEPPGASLKAESRSRYVFIMASADEDTLFPSAYKPILSGRTARVKEERSAGGSQKRVLRAGPRSSTAKGIWFTGPLR